MRMAANLKPCAASTLLALSTAIGELRKICMTHLQVGGFVCASVCCRANYQHVIHLLDHRCKAAMAGNGYLIDRLIDLYFVWDPALVIRL